MVWLAPVLLVIFFLHILYSGGNNASLSGIVVHALANKSANIDYREIENFNLYFSIINNPVLGLGYGRPFPVILPMPDISFVFKLYDLIPHNSALYLWAFAGPMGMAGLGVAMVVPLIACVRLIKFSRRDDATMIAFVCFTLVIGWFCFVYFDMGILDSRAQALYGIFVGAAMSLYQKAFEYEVAGNIS